ncbi:MAG: acyl-CoA thioesterase [Candidatus Kapaibacteriota bacterium]
MNLENQKQNGFSLTVRERIRYADVDKMGVVYNGNYLRLFEIGRTELMRTIGIPYTDVEQFGYLLPLVEAAIQWKGFAKYDDIVEIRTTFNPANLSSTIRFDYEIFNEGNLIVRGYTLHSFVRSESFQAVKPPKFFIEHLRKLTNNE